MSAEHDGPAAVPDMVPTAREFVDWWERQPDSRRLQVAGDIIANQAAWDLCFVMNHKGTIEDLERRLRDVHQRPAPSSWLGW